MAAQITGQQALADYANIDRVGYPGQIASSIGYESTEAMRNATAGELPFGRGVCRSTTDLAACVLPGIGLQFLGITTNLQNFAQTSSQVGAPVGTPMGILAKGQIWVQVSVAVTPQTTPLLVIGTGAISGGSAVGGTSYAIPNAKFLSSAAINGYAILELNGHGGVVA